MANESLVQTTLHNFLRPLAYDRMPMTRLWKPFNILGLPIEILYEVLAHLDYKSMARCRQVCYDMQSLIDNSSRLQLPLLYARYNLVHPRSTPYPDSVSACARLKRREYNWAHLRPAYSTSSVVQGNPRRSSHVRMFNDILTMRYRDLNDDQVITFLRIPDNLHPRISMQEWSYTYPVLEDGHILSICVDESQDLLVLLVYVGSPNGPIQPTGFNYAVKFLKLSDGTGHTPHPGAADFSVSLSRSAIFGVTGSHHPTFRLHLRGAALLIHSRDSDSAIMTTVSLMDWKWGIPTFHKLEMPSGADIVYDACFITSSLFMLFDPDNAQIDLYQIRRSSTLSASHGPSFYASFTLPELVEGYAYRAAHLSASGAVSPLEKGPSEPHFQTCPNRGIIVLGVCVYRPENGLIGWDTHYLDIVILIENLVSLAASQNPSVHHKGTCVSESWHPCRSPTRPHFHPVPWSEWGAECARVFQQDVCDSSWGAVHGYRVVRAFHTKRGALATDNATHTRVHILDFNPRTLDEEKNIITPLWGPPQIDSDGFPQIIHGEHLRAITSPFWAGAFDDYIFAEEVYCPMPYRETYRSDEHVLDNAYLTSNGLVTVARAARQHSAETEISSVMVVASMM